MTSNELSLGVFRDAWIANGGDPNEAEAAYQRHTERQEADARAAERLEATEREREKRERKQRELEAEYAPEPTDQQGDEMARHAFRNATLRSL